MMKMLLIGVGAVAGLLLTAGCKNDTKRERASSVVEEGTGGAGLEGTGGAGLVGDSMRSVPRGEGPGDPALNYIQDGSDGSGPVQSSPKPKSVEEDAKWRSHFGGTPSEK